MWWWIFLLAAAWGLFGWSLCIISARATRDSEKMTREWIEKQR